MQDILFWPSFGSISKKSRFFRCIFKINHLNSKGSIVTNAVNSRLVGFLSQRWLLCISWHRLGSLPKSLNSPGKQSGLFALYIVYNESQLAYVFKLEASWYVNRQRRFPSSSLSIIKMVNHSNQSNKWKSLELIVITLRMQYICVCVLFSVNVSTHDMNDKRSRMLDKKRTNIWKNRHRYRDKNDNVSHFFSLPHQFQTLNKQWIDNTYTILWLPQIKCVDNDVSWFSLYLAFER